MTVFDVEGLLPATELAAPAHVRRTDLPWVQGADPSIPLIDWGDESGSRQSVGRLGAWLRDAQVLDPYAVPLPGATIMLPYGVLLVRQMEGIVRRNYEAAGYEEYDFPFLTSPDIMTPTRDILPLDNALLLAGSDNDWQSGHPRAVLSPTGEASIYSYWARTIRSRSDLPRRVFRKARYFRPVHSGASFLRAIESGDVFEFMAAHQDANTNSITFMEAIRMIGDTCADVHVPVLMSTRPPWTNNGAVADVCVGVDVPLPHGATLQVGCLYDQGDRFSRQYGVAWRADGMRHPTRHVAGCVTRRLLLAHLFLGMNRKGELLIHPDLAPHQIAATFDPLDTGSGDLARKLTAALGDRGVRMRMVGTDRPRSVGSTHRLWRMQGIPVRMYIHSGRDRNPVRVVVVRGDTADESSVEVSVHDHLVEQLILLLAEVGAAYDHRAHRFVSGQCRMATADTVRKVVKERHVALCPIEPTKEAMEAVAAWRIGEVIGLRRGTREQPCVITGHPTQVIAYIAPRT